MTPRPWGEVKVGDYIRISHGFYVDVEGEVIKDCGSHAGKRMMRVIHAGNDRIINYATHRSVEVVE